MTTMAKSVLQALGGSVTAFDQTQGDDPQTSTADRIIDILLADLSPDPDQPRKYFDQDALDVLSASLKATQRNLVPIHVRHNPAAAGKYIIIEGERRYRAAPKAGLDRLRSIVFPDATSAELLAHQLVVDIREGLRPLERASAFMAMASLGLSQSAIAQRLGITQKTVSSMIAMAKEEDPLILQAIEHSLITNSEDHRRVRILPADTRSRLLKGALRDGVKIGRRQLVVLEERLKERADRASRPPAPPQGEEATPSPRTPPEEAIPLELDRRLLARLFRRLDLGPLPQDPQEALASFLESLPDPDEDR